MHTEHSNTARNVWLGIAVGAAIGLGFALSRRKRDRWRSAKHITKRISRNSEDLAEKGRQILDRVKVIYEEGRKIAEDAADLWAQGRRLVRA